MIKEKLKWLGKAIFACLALVVIVIVPVLLSLIAYYLSDFIVSDYSTDLISFLEGSFLASMLGFFWYIYLFKTQKVIKNA